MDSSETLPGTEDGLSNSQRIQLEILKDTFFEKHGADNDILEVFFKTPPGAQWPIFTLLYPKVVFLIEKIVDVIREVDKLFINEYDIKLFGIESPLLYVRNDRINEWRERFDDIVAAGPGSSLWGETAWEIKREAKKTDGGSLIAQMDLSLVEMPERVLSKLETGVADIKIRFDFLASRMAMIDRCEREHRKESSELRRRKLVTSESSSDSNSTEARSSSFSIANDRLPGADEATIETQTTALELPRPVPNLSRTHIRRSQPAYPNFQAKNPPISSKSLLMSHSTIKWQGLVPNWSFLGEKTTVLCLLPCLIVISAILIGIAITRSRSPACVVPISNDDSFFANVSQTIVSLSSLYCIMIPFLRSREVSLNLFWFRVCLLFSAGTGVASVVLYVFQ